MFTGIIVTASITLGTKTPNKACSGWWGVCGFDKHFSGFGFFLLSGIISARPTTTNANR